MYSPRGIRAGGFFSALVFYGCTFFHHFFFFFFCCFLPRSIFSSRNFLQFAILPGTPAAGRSGFAAGMTNSNNNILSRQMSVKKVSENIRWNSSDYSCSLIHSLIRQWPTCSACSGTHRVSVIVKCIVFQRSEARRLEMYWQNNDLPNRVTSVWDCVSTFPRVEPLCIFEQVTTTFQHLNCSHRRIF